MSAFVFTNAAITINSVDLSDHGINVSLPFKADDIDITAFNSGGWRAHLPGLKGATLSLQFNQDFAASKVDATLFAIYNGGVAVPVAVKAVNATTSATNPEFQFNGILTSYTPLGNAVGEGAKAPAEITITGAVTRAVS